MGIELPLGILAEVLGIGVDPEGNGVGALVQVAQLALGGKGTHVVGAIQVKPLAELGSRPGGRTA